MIENKGIYASALIYGRMYYRDYDASFLLRPDDFSLEDILWARRYVLEAVAYCDELEGIRYVVFGNEKYLVFGIAGILSDLLSKNLPVGEFEQFQPYAFDESGRNIKSFLGFVCHMKEKEKGVFFKLEGSDFIEFYKKNIAKEDAWYSREWEGHTSQYEYKLEQGSLQGMGKPVECVILSEEKGDQELFRQMLAESAYDQDCISLCTNVYNRQMAEKGIFSYVTAKKDVVERCKRKIHQPHRSEKKMEEGRRGRNHESVISEKKNRDSAAVIVSAIALIVVIIVSVLIIYSKKVRFEEMGSIYDAFYQEGKINSGHRTLDDLAECQRNYAKLLREYKPEIEYVERCLKELREEEKNFYVQELPQILEILKCDEVSEETRRVWIERLRENMERSFGMSRNLLQDLAVKQMDEFKQDAERILKGGIMI